MDEPTVTAFLSSTSKDLRDHRARVRSHCSAFSYAFRMMEEFGAQDGGAVPVSVGELEGCEVFVGIYARRYGFVSPGSGKGVTEVEYDAADMRSLPRLLFVVAPDYRSYPLLEEHRDDDVPDRAERLQRFLDRVGTERVWDTFTTPEHLANRVAFAISKWEGWRPLHPKPPRFRYIGRSELLERLKASLASGSRIALTGIGGIGKTLTAAEIAQRTAARYPGGILWLTMGPEARDPGHVLDAAMRAWAASHHPGRLTERSNLTPESVRRWIAEAQGAVLIVLDDVWHARVGREILRLVPANASLLVTTRRRDAARQMNTEIVTVEQLSPEEALAFLRDRVGDLPSLATLQRLAELLEGHPLALEIVAAQIAGGPPDLAESLPDAIAARLRDDPGTGLIGFEADLDAPVEADEDRRRYASVAAALQLTYDTFPADLKRRFRATGTAAPETVLTEQLLATLWGDDLAAEGVREEFDSRTTALVSSGVLTREATGFTRHTLVRLYALSLARESGEAGDDDDRYAAYVLDSVLPRLRTVEPAHWDRVLGDELPHVHFVGDRLARQISNTIETSAERMIRFASGVENYLEHRRDIAAAHWLEAATLACNRLGDRAGEVRFLNALAGFHFARRDSRKGLKAAYDAWQLAIEHKDRAGQARAALFLGYHYTHSDPFEAPRYFEGAARHFEALNDHPGRVEALIQLAGCHSDSIHLPPVRRQGFALLQEALDLSRSADYALGEIRALTRLGLLHESLAEYPAARDRLREAADAARSLGSRAEEGVALVGLGAVLVELNEYDAAAAVLESCEELFDAVGDQVGRATALRNAAQLAALRGDHARAAELYVKALPFIRRRTMMELDAFAHEDMRALRTLTIRLDDVLFNDTREQYRAKLFEEIEEFKQTEGRALLPEDIYAFLFRRSVAVAGTEGAASWASTLERFVFSIETLGKAYAADAEFVRALADAVIGNATELPESHLYFVHVQNLMVRLEQKKHGQPNLAVNELQHLFSNTYAALRSERHEQREWAAELRRLRHDLELWGNRDDAELVSTLLALVVGQLGSVGRDNVYAGAFAQLEEAVSHQSELPLDWIERSSIDCKVSQSEDLGEWCERLEQALVLANVRREQREREYLDAVLATLAGRNASLPDGHEYRRSLDYIKSMTAAQVPSPGLTGSQIRLFYRAATESKRREQAQQMFQELIVKASSAGDVHEEAFFRALLAVASSTKSAEMSDTNPYRIYLETRLGVHTDGKR